MDVLDFLLFPLYVGLFYFFVRRRAVKIANPVLSVYYKRAFYIRIISTVAFSIFLVYISGGDSFSTYYAEGLNIYKSMLKDVTTIDKMIFTSAKNIDPSLFDQNVGGSVVFATENNYMVARLAGVALFFTFGKYLLCNFLFSMLAFEGCWRLYKFFYEQYPHLHRELAISILYFPTFIFWSSGISKEAVCMAGIGFITYGFYNIFIKRKMLLSSAFWVFVFSFLLVCVKIYILLSYIPFLVLFFVLKNISKLKSNFMKVMVGPFLILASVAVIAVVMVGNKDALGSYSVDVVAESIQKQQQNFQLQDNSESNFSLGVDFDGSIGSLVAATPLAVAATLFRPFLWEARKVSSLLSALESLVLLWFTLKVFFKTGPLFFMRTVIQKPIILYCFFFALIFGIFVGLSTLNFGSLVRYKIPCLPFYAISLFLIYDEYKNNRKKNAIPLPSVARK